MRTARFRCPRCGSDRVARIVYGTPAWSAELKREVAAGRVVLAGCLVTDAAPDRQCGGCGHEFGLASASSYADPTSSSPGAARDA